MYYPFRDPFSIEMTQLINQMEIAKKTKKLLNQIAIFNSLILFYIGPKGPTVLECWLSSTELPLDVVNTAIINNEPITRVLLKA